MNYNQLLAQTKQELFGGWKPFEAAWLLLFIAVQIGIYIYNPDSILGMVSGIAGIICNVFVSKGKISNYFFGLIFAYTYFYISLGANFLGEMNTTLYVYIPAQFIGYFLWKANMQKEQNSAAVIAKALTVKGWIGLLAFLIIGTLLFVELLNYYGGSSTGLDGLSTIIVIAAQVLMVLRYREQWLLWIVLNIISIALWAENTSMYVMYSAYLLNSLYGYYNWSKLQKTNN
ncbi:nicotinamide riboside transporter PnuC [Haemophilus parahaemolyticus]|uniref:Nicotinamide riboside transporter PnuC n=3 Tax=Haemophilus parahaemolyticus TaxID=735 RepID=A0AAE6JSM8_HAEPH|nr:nicotinamide riboside transporter PnuC [Haemophilus parahaemolyticus]EIJ67545.1 nicotinamide riboside transporter PnuC [Haemophilus parahaemolyticus HK385]OOR95413.1 nicotinamide riboside transporter pnuC [Haemophilus parahaemolyticus]QEN11387.1 nicotinamide riboside transporter PnuC [Haemophilus parahaemolyticus]QEN11389.1 nicotinamide riboside transporter PnuC [Haemophilus parahaemolyticus]QRP12582.1 nicotinamide riboside transporter PnuC [Haemophilus parahaemolyticus]